MNDMHDMLMKILIGFDGSDCSVAALTDLQRAGLPEKSNAVVVTAADVFCPPKDRKHPLFRKARADCSVEAVRRNSGSWLEIYASSINGTEPKTSVFCIVVLFDLLEKTPRAFAPQMLTSDDLSILC